MNGSTGSCLSLLTNAKFSTSENNNISTIVMKVGFDGLEWVVNKNNTIDSISEEQVAKLFSGETRDWSELGVEVEITSTHRSGNDFCNRRRGFGLKEAIKLRVR